MSSYQATSPNPVVLLSSVSVNLSPGAITELTGMGQNIEDLALKPIANTDDALVIGNDDDDWFQPGPSTSRCTPRLPAGRKNIETMLKSLRSPSLTPSRSTAAEDSSDDDWMRFIEEEQQRRAAEEARRVEWHRRAAGRMEEEERKLNKARELVSSLKGERKSLRKQREALREQLRALDQQDLCLDERERSALFKMKKHESIVAKYKAMNI